MGELDYGAHMIRLGGVGMQTGMQAGAGHKALQKPHERRENCGEQ